MNQIINIELDKIQIPDLRVTSQVDDETQAELVESVRKNGILQPLTVSRMGDNLALVDGLHRLWAAKEAGLTTVPCLVTEEPEADLMLKNLYLNRQRGRSNPAEEAQVVRYLEEESKLSLEEIVSRTGISRPRVRELLEISRLPPQILGLVASRELGITHAVELLVLKTDEDRLQVATDAVQWHYTRDQVRLRVQELLNPRLAPVPGSITFQPGGEPVRVAIPCSLCGVDLGDNKSYIWACLDCIAFCQAAYRLAEAQQAAERAAAAPPPPPRYTLTDRGWEREP